MTIYKHTRLTPSLSLSDKKRFLEKVSIPDDSDGCWEWKASLNRYGYGYFRVGRTMETAHRVAVMIDGRDPYGHCCLHTCDNRACVNPRHIYLGSDADNVRDRDLRTDMSKQREVARRTAPMAARTLRKLTAEQAREIRLRYQKGGILQRELGEDYGVDYRTVGYIVNGKTYRESECLAS